MSTLVIARQACNEGNIDENGHVHENDLHLANKGYH